MHHCAYVAILHMSWLTNAQLLFTWKQSLLGFPSSYLNICYYHQDLQHWQFHVGLHHAFDNKHIKSHCRRNGLISAARFSAIHVRGHSIRQVSCYTYQNQGHWDIGFPVRCAQCWVLESSHAC